jgi:MFS family permease
MEIKTSRPPGWFYPWAIVGILWIVAFLNYFDRNLITSMRDPIVGDFKLTDAQFGLLTSVFLWSYGFLSPLGGYFADKYGRKKIIVFSVCVWSAVTLWTGFVTSFNEMLIARIIMGISEACYIPAGLAMIADYHKGKTRSLATGSAHEWFIRRAGIWRHWRLHLGIMGLAFRFPGNWLIWYCIWPYIDLFFTG